MVVYRITRSRHAADLSGEGARLCKGRWNLVGVPMIYTASSVALAALELFVNVPHGLVKIAGFKRVDIYFPDSATIEYLELTDLPGDWSNVTAPDTIGEIGRIWANKCSSLVLRVPSAAIGGHEYNYLINPGHPDISAVKIVGSSVLSSCPIREGADRDGNPYASYLKTLYGF
jgi:RES domain-containing protein